MTAAILTPNPARKRTFHLGCDCGWRHHRPVRFATAVTLYGQHSCTGGQS